MCLLYTCPQGPESVIIKNVAARMLVGLASAAGPETVPGTATWMQQHRQQHPPWQLRRRLADFEDVEFEIPTGDDSVELTGAQQAAALFNKIADPVRGEGGLVLYE